MDGTEKGVGEGGEGVNKSRFDEIVQNRANQRVQSKVEKFKASVHAACKELTGEYGSYGNPFRYEKEFHAALLALIGDDKGDNKTWPKSLWAKEEQAVEKELMATLDEMSKALIAPPPSQDSIQPSK